MKGSEAKRQFSAVDRTVGFALGRSKMLYFSTEIDCHSLRHVHPSGYTRHSIRIANEIGRQTIALPRSKVRRLRLFRHPFARELVEQIVTRHGVGEEAVERLQDGRLKRDQASAAAGEVHIAMSRGLFQ
jgi:hypothetical protein